MKKIVLITSLYRLRKHNACEDRYNHLVEALGPEWGDKDDISLLDILKHNGASDCLWALCATVRHPEVDKAMRLMAADFAEAVLPIFEKEYPDDKRPRLAIKAARDFANGKTTAQAGTAAWAAAGDAAWTAAGAAAGAAGAAAGGAWDAAWAARTAAWGAWAAAGDAQAVIIRKYLGR